MTRTTRRIQLAPAYILHHRPYRDTSRIFEVLTREHGRLSLFARGVRGPKAKLASILQPFQLLLLSAVVQLLVFLLLCLGCLGPSNASQQVGISS